MKLRPFAVVIVVLILSRSYSFGQSAKEVTNSIDAKFVLIPQGKFTMGAADTEDGSEDDELQHHVTISKPFYLGTHEVTQGEYEQVMGTNPSHFQKRVIRKNNSGNYPVEQVSWEDAMEFCKKLSDTPKEKAAKRIYRLPTEAEWEWACRAGGSSAALKSSRWSGPSCCNPLRLREVPRQAREAFKVQADLRPGIAHHYALHQEPDQPFLLGGE